MQVVNNSRIIIRVYPRMGVTAAASVNAVRMSLLFGQHAFWDTVHIRGPGWAPIHPAYWDGVHSFDAWMVAVHAF